MRNMNQDTFLEILKNLHSINDIVELCKSDYKAREICNSNKGMISKMIVKLHNLDHTDPNDFIYKFTNTSINDVIINDNVDYIRIFKLYKKALGIVNKTQNLNLYSNKFKEIRSIPIFENL